MSQAFVAPDWLLRWEATNELLLLDLSTAENFLIEGKLASALISGSHFPLIEGLSLVQPSLSRFVSDWKANGVQSFTRRALLQGSGWSTCFLELTARCNERCLHCYAESSPSRTEELPIQKVLEVIKSAGILGFQRLQLTGGDPLIASSCAQAAEFAASIGLPVIEIYTNGLALHGTLFERLRDIKASFAFSVYSHDSSRHDAITRHQGSHNLTLAAIERALEAGLDVRAGIVVMELNSDDVEATYQMLRQLGVSQIGIDIQRGVGRGIWSPRTLPSLSADTYGVHSGIKNSDNNTISQFDGRIAILANGQVAPCIFQRETVLGSIFEETLESVLLRDMPLIELGMSTMQEAKARFDKLGCHQCRTRAAFLDLATCQAPLRT